MAQQFQLDDTQLASMSADLKQQQTMAWSGALAQKPQTEVPVTQLPVEGARCRLLTRHPLRPRMFWRHWLIISNSYKK